MAFTKFVYKPRTQPLGTATDIRIVGDEDGFELHFTTQDDAFVVNIHGVAEELLTAAQGEIGEWLEEGGRARAERRHDAEQRDAYDLRTDPKHPDWHSVHADRYDTMRGDR